MLLQDPTGLYKCSGCGLRFCSVFPHVNFTSTSVLAWNLSAAQLGRYILKLQIYNVVELEISEIYVFASNDLLEQQFSLVFWSLLLGNKSFHVKQLLCVYLRNLQDFFPTGHNKTSSKSFKLKVPSAFLSRCFSSLSSFPLTLKLTFSVPRLVPSLFKSQAFKSLRVRNIAESKAGNHLFNTIHYDPDVCFMLCLSCLFLSTYLTNYMEICPQGFSHAILMTFLLLNETSSFPC